MPNSYHHLTYDQRCQIYALKKSGHTQLEIAEQIGTAQSTVSRELMNNSGRRGYRYKQAHKKFIQRRAKASSVKRKMTPTTIPLVERMLCQDQWSPEQISGRLKLIYKISLSHESIYRHIWNDKGNGGNLYKNLRRIMVYLETIRKVVQ